MSPEVQHHQISSRGCERATSGTGNKIITHEGKTHVTWLDSTEEGFFARVRTLDRKTGEWSPVYTLGTANGNHGRPALTIDSKGYLHTVYGVHHNTVPYRSSVRPNDASEWTEERTFGGGVTYPTLICGPDDTLYMTGREGWSGVTMYAKPPGRDWEGRGLIISIEEGCFSYAAFHSGLAWSPDHQVLHLSTSSYQSKTEESNRWGAIQSANYMRSIDFGRTWQRADGTPIELPATSKTMDVLAWDESLYPKPGIRNLGALVVDSTGKPYVVYLRYNMEPPGQAFLVTPDERGEWQHLPLQEAVEEHWPGYAVVDCRSGMTITEGDVICIVLGIQPREHPVAEKERALWGKPYDYAADVYSTNEENARLGAESARLWAKENPGVTKVAWLETRDGGRTFTARSPLNPEPGMIVNQPSLEMPTGFNRISAGSYPAFLYFTGLARNAAPDEVIDNNVYYVQVKRAERR